MLIWRTRASLNSLWHPSALRTRTRNHHTLAPGGSDDARPLLRRVAPYWAVYTTIAKDRWLGRKLFDVFSIEFMERSSEYREWAMASGLILVNGQRATRETVIRKDDWIATYVHRHEPPVTACPPTILHRDPAGRFVAVAKPHGLPVHPTGSYHLNSLTEILRHDFGFRDVFPVNRLDLITGGVMLLALDAGMARTISKEMSRTSQAVKEGTTKEARGVIAKEYLAKVHGAFPEGETFVDRPLVTISRPYGLTVAHPEGKPARTVFKRLRYSPTSHTSLVLCRPITGRTHQLRVHLQHLGHPIVGDMLYSDENVWGTPHGAGDVSEAVSPGVLGADAADIRSGSPVRLSDALVQVIQNVRAKHDARMGFARAHDLHFRDQPPLSLDALREQGVLVPPVPPHPHELNAIRRARRTSQVDGMNSADLPPDAGEGAATLLSSPGLAMDEWADGSATVRARPAVTFSPAITEVEDGYCPTCFAPSRPDPRPERMAICLHAWRYAGSVLRREGDGKAAEGVFEAPVPAWARELEGEAV